MEHVLNQKQTPNKRLLARTACIFLAGICAAFAMIAFWLAMGPSSNDSILLNVWGSINYPAIWFSERWLKDEIPFLSRNLLPGDMGGFFVAPVVGIFVQWIGLATVVAGVDAARILKLKMLFWFLVMAAIGLALIVIVQWFS